MKKVTIIITLFLLGTTFAVNAQEMTQKEKNNYSIGVLLGKKIHEEIQKSGVDMSVIETLKEKFKELVDLESIKEGLRDILKGECKLAQEEVEATLKELEKEKDKLEKLLKGDQNNENVNVVENKEPTNYYSVLARRHGTTSWYYLFIKDYKQSEQNARQALELDNTQTWVKVNLAHALLFQNRFADAEAIYKELSKTIYENNETYTNVLLKDFQELEEAGVIPENCKVNVEKIKQMLQK